MFEEAAGADCSGTVSSLRLAQCWAGWVEWWELTTLWDPAWLWPWPPASLSAVSFSQLSSPLSTFILTTPRHSTLSWSCESSTESTFSTISSDGSMFCFWFRVVVAVNFSWQTIKRHDNRTVRGLLVSAHLYDCPPPPPTPAPAGWWWWGWAWRCCSWDRLQWAAWIRAPAGENERTAQESYKWYKMLKACVRGVIWTIFFWKEPTAISLAMKTY